MWMFWIALDIIIFSFMVAGRSYTPAELKCKVKREHDAGRKAERAAPREYKPEQIVYLQGRRVRLVPTR